MNDIAKLLQDHKRLILTEASKYAKYVPLHVVEAQAYNIATEAARNYDPKTGLKFSTYLVNQLKKLSRISTQYGAIARIPENKQFRIQKLNKSEEELHSILDREPTADEVSEHTGMSIGEINKLKQYRKKDVGVSSLSYTPVFVDNENDDWIHYVYHDLAPRDKFIFEHKTGFGGKPVLENEAIAKKLKLTPAIVSSRVKIISDALAEGYKFNES